MVELQGQDEKTLFLVSFGERSPFGRTGIQDRCGEDLSGQIMDQNLGFMNVARENRLELWWDVSQINDIRDLSEGVPDRTHSGSFKRLVRTEKKRIDRVAFPAGSLHDLRKLCSYRVSNEGEACQSNGHPPRPESERSRFVEDEETRVFGEKAEWNLRSFMVPWHQVYGDPCIGHFFEWLQGHDHQFGWNPASIEQITTMDDSVYLTFQGWFKCLPITGKEIGPPSSFFHSRSERHVETQVSIGQEEDSR